MKKINLLFIFLFLTFEAFAAQKNICRRGWSAYDSLQIDLHLNVDLQEALIFIDRQIAYGIRPYGSKILKAVCDIDANALKIYSTTDLGENFIFSFYSDSTSQNQSGIMPGYITYFDQTEDPTYTQEWQCSKEAVKNICLEL